MQGTMAENLAKVFMITIRYLISGLLLLSTLVTFITCEETFEDPSIPFIDFQDKVIDLSLPAYQELRPDKSHMILSDIGVRGVILYHETGDEYYAYEINCSFQPGDAGANVQVHSSSLFLTDTSCGSNFSLPDGVPTAGPARSPLRLYEVRLSGSTLTITDNSANGF